MAEESLHGDRLLPVGSELGPVVGHLLTVVQQTSEETDRANTQKFVVSVDLSGQDSLDETEVKTLERREQQGSCAQHCYYCCASLFPDTSTTQRLNRGTIGFLPSGTIHLSTSMATHRALTPLVEEKRVVRVFSLYGS